MLSYVILKRRIRIVTRNNKRPSILRSNLSSHVRPRKKSVHVPPKPLVHPEINSVDTKSDEICYSSITKINELLDSSKITIDEVAQQIIDRQQKLADYNFIVSDSAPVTDTEAKILTAKRKQGNHRKFFSYALKDTSTMARGDVILTEGSLLRSIYGPLPQHTPLSRILIDLEGLFTGTTSLPEWSHKMDTENLVIGQSYNPHNPELTVGGSSGGSAGAVACGMAHVAFGTDSAGSIVIPAAFSGVVGMKPQKHKFQPIKDAPKVQLGFGSSHLFKGWFTRTVEDTAVMMNLLDASDQYTRHLVQPPKKYKVGFLPYFDYCRELMDQQVLDIIGQSVNNLQSHLGQEFPIFHSFGFRDPSWSADVLWKEYYAALYDAHVTTYQDSVPDWEKKVSASLLKLMHSGKALTKEEKKFAKETHDEVASKIQQFFNSRELDFIITPATPVLPWKAGEERPKKFNGHAGSAHTPFTYIFNYSRSPSITLPCGLALVNNNTDYPVPVGLQIVSATNVSTEKLLQFAYLCEQVFGYSKKPRWPNLSLMNTSPVKIIDPSAYVSPNATVKELKEAIQKEKGTSLERLQLVLGNMVLEDSEKLCNLGVDSLQLVTLATANVIGF